jgi:hypothetical protein
VQFVQEADCAGAAQAAHNLVAWVCLVGNSGSLQVREFATPPIRGVVLYHLRCPAAWAALFHTTAL